MKPLNNIFVNFVIYSGASAFNINGKTLHSEFALNPWNISNQLSISKKKELIEKFKRAVVFIVDERSMISSEILGACERNMKQTIYGGVCEDNDFGGIPVVLLVGDDFQIPPVVIRGKGKGAFHIFAEKQISQIQTHVMLDEVCGINLFMTLTTNVMELKSRRRQQNDSNMIDILDDLEHGEPNDNTINRLLKLDLNNFPSEMQQEIKKKATYIFATHDEKNKHNLEQLLRICSDTNPLACLGCQDISSPRKYKKTHFDRKSIPMRTHLSIGCRVAITGRNIEPRWGLFNGAIGEVKVIVFDVGKDPNNGDLPAYVAVEIFTYNPPASVPPFDINNPKVCLIIITHYWFVYFHSILTYVMSKLFQQIIPIL